jgi:hypothetical protein
MRCNHNLDLGIAWFAFQDFWANKYPARCVLRQKPQPCAAGQKLQKLEGTVAHQKIKHRRKNGSY